MDFDLKAHTILGTICGSHAYGIATSTSDVDIKCVTIPPVEYYTGFIKRFEQADKPEHMQVFLDSLPLNLQERAKETKLEGTAYEFRKLLKLATEANPNILDLLFCDDSDVFLMTELGKLLRDNRDLFLSKKARWTFASYAFAQLKRINTHRQYLLNPMEKEPLRSDYSLKEKMEIPKEQLEAIDAEVAKQLDRWNDDFGNEIDSATKMNIRENVANLLTELKIASEDRYKLAVNNLGLDINFIRYLQKEHEYKLAMQQWKQYLNWQKTRNPERAALENKFGYDLKHGSHLYRLMIMCEEILETGKVTVKRPDAAQILAIRNGAWSYEKLKAWFEEKEARISELYVTSNVLKREPDRKAIDELCQEVISKYIKNNG